MTLEFRSSLICSLAVALLGALVSAASARAFDGESLLQPCVAESLTPSTDPLDANYHSPIYRGALVSDYEIAPYKKRFTGYGIGSWANQEAQDATANRPGFEVGSWFGGFGTDWSLFQHGLWGYGVQGGRVKIDPRSGGKYESRINSLSGNLHISIYDALWRFDVMFGMGKNWHKQHEFSWDDTNSFTTTQWLVGTEFSAKFDKGYTRIEPLVNFRVLNLSEPKSAERYVAATSREAREFNDASYRLKVGSRFSWEHSMALGTLRPYLAATWSHEFGKREIYTVGDATPFPIAFRYGRHRMPRDRFDLGGGLGAALRDQLDVYLQYDVAFAKEYVDYAFLAGFNKKF